MPYMCSAKVYGPGDGSRVRPSIPSILRDAWSVRQYDSLRWAEPKTTSALRLREGSECNNAESF
jgi:hypothetical protein